LEKRLELTKIIGRDKKQAGLPIEDLQREKEIIEDKIRKSGLRPEFIEELFNTIFKESKRLQNES